MTDIYEVYTDGSCFADDRIGGWAYTIYRLLSDGTTENYEDSEGKDDTTNNRMELTAILAALVRIVSLDDKNPMVYIYTDSRWAMNCLRREWNCVKNTDILEEIWRYSINMNIEYIWVKGHSKDARNNRVDQLAYSAAKRFMI